MYLNPHSSKQHLNLHEFVNSGDIKLMQIIQTLTYVKYKVIQTKVSYVHTKIR